MIWKKIIYFLGSVYLAVALLASSAVIVIIGTLAESFTDSHLYASSLAYSNPIFLLLLSLFFVNIFVSAIRRWPFQSKHIPFLLTHLGLLMIIGGVMVKNIVGTQGKMGLLEGTATNTILIPDTYRLHVKNRAGKLEQLPLTSEKIVNFFPHGKESFETWIKGSLAFLDGIKPFPVYQYEGKVEVASRMRIPGDTSDHWDLYAYHAEDPLEVAKKVYLEGLNFRISDRKTQKVISEGETTKAELNWEEVPTLSFPSGITITLSGDQALLNQPFRSTAIDLMTTPKLLFVKDKIGDTHFFAFDAFGHVFREVFHQDKLQNYISYDGGFSGYSVQTKIPKPLSRTEKELEIAKQITKQLESFSTLAPPLQLLKKNLENVPSFLLEQKLIAPLDWSEVSPREQKGCQWGAFLLAELEGEEDIKTYLKNWPLASLMNLDTDPDELLSALLQQVFMVAEELPECPQESTEEQLLSTYLQVYGIPPASFMADQSVSSGEQMVFECPLTVHHEPQEPHLKREENRPMIVVKQGGVYQTLLFDPHGVALSWPKGGDLLSFRPEIHQIPYKVRLRDARQINYPQMDQAYSYESDLLITDLKKQTQVEKTVSMNEVHETWDGYRFYLSNIYPHEETAVQHIQLVVNRDPVKYWLTYPGGGIVALGIILLFFRASKKN